jgi:hypothetical protein
MNDVDRDIEQEIPLRLSIIRRMHWEGIWHMVAILGAWATVLGLMA